MGTFFTILVVALAFFSIVIMMAIVLREKVDHEAHRRYVRSPWNDEVDVTTQQGAPAAGSDETEETQV
jgi:hypothetical protein